MVMVGEPWQDLDIPALLSDKCRSEEPYELRGSCSVYNAISALAQPCSVAETGLHAR